MGQHSSASASRLLGLDGFEVLAAQVVGGEWQLKVQTTAPAVGCQGCGVRAELHGRRRVQVRDLPIGGRPVVLAWRKRLWRCREPACAVRTWTEQQAAIRPRAVLVVGWLSRLTDSMRPLFCVVGWSASMPAPKPGRPGEPNEQAD